MSHYWLASEDSIRLSVTLGLLLMFAAMECVVPRKMRVERRRSRWLGNGLLQLFNSLALRLAVPWIVPTGVALIAQQKGMGLFHWLTLPEGVTFILSIVLLDLAIYWQHRLTHWVPALWRLHRVHHADVDVDVTTALRFHPLEILLSAAFKSALVWIFGVSADAIILFAVMLNGMAMFNHANIRLPLRLELVLRPLVVTPDMHRVHHSVVREEQNSNFGFNLSCWDRLFGTYKKQPASGHQKMLLGLNETKGQTTGSVIWMLKQPFV